ncbi:MAG: hypothetical protein COB76_01950 [Alphaproteobacteria bacterium]|nr:MAG: hypothetical protein COB76_01950 [Alphaproteobacteria bacterium]
MTLENRLILSKEIRRIQSDAHSGVFLSREEERELIGKYQAGDKAAGDKVIVAHRFLAVHEARKKMKGRYPADDLIQDAYVGLCKALDTFDLDRDARFSTHATFAILGETYPALMGQTYALNLPVSRVPKMIFSKLRKAEADIRLKNPSMLQGELDEAVATKMGVTMEILRAVKNIMDGSLSLDAPVDVNGESRSFVENLPSPDLTPGDIYEKKNERENEKSMLSEAFAAADLSERDLAIFKARRLTDKPKGLWDVGKDFNMSGERVRQIENKAFEKLKKAAQGIRGKKNEKFNARMLDL